MLRVEPDLVRIGLLPRPGERVGHTRRGGVPGVTHGQVSLGGRLHGLVGLGADMAAATHAAQTGASALRLEWLDERDGLSSGCWAGTVDTAGAPLRNAGVDSRRRGMRHVVPLR